MTRLGVMSEPFLEILVPGKRSQTECCSYRLLRVLLSTFDLTFGAGRAWLRSRCKRRSCGAKASGFSPLRDGSFGNRDRVARFASGALIGLSASAWALSKLLAWGSPCLADSRSSQEQASPPRP